MSRKKREREVNECRVLKAIVFRATRASCQFAREFCHRLVFHRDSICIYIEFGCIYQTKITLKCTSQNESNNSDSI